MSESETNNDEEHREVSTIDPEKEPEYVGAHSALATRDCRNWLDPAPDGQCSNEATHTVVMFHKELHEIAMCDDCGEPEDAADDREWSGKLEDAP